MRLAGKWSVTVDGQELLTKIGATLTYGPKRTMQPGTKGVHGFTEEDTVPMIDCTISVSGATKVEDIQKITNGSGLFTSDAGNSFVLTGVACLEPTQIKAGECALKFGAMTCDEL